MSVTPYTSGTSAGLKSSLNSPLSSSLSPANSQPLLNLSLCKHCMAGWALYQGFRLTAGTRHCWRRLSCDGRERGSILGSSPLLILSSNLGPLELLDTAKSPYQEPLLRFNDIPASSRLLRCLTTILSSIIPPFSRRPPLHFLLSP